MASEVKLNNRALANSLIFHASIGNIDHIGSLCRKLPKALAEAISKATAAPEMKKRIIEIVGWPAKNELKNPPAIFKVIALVPLILSYCGPKELSRAAATNSIFQSQGQLGMLQQLQTRRSYSLGDLILYRNALRLATPSEVLRIYPEKTSLITHLDLSNDKNMAVITLEKYLQLAPNLKSIKLSLSFNQSEEFFLTLGKNGKDLTSIDFSEGAITEHNIQTLVLCCPRLTSLSLADCELTDNAIAHLLANCEDITSLNVSGCWQLTDFTMKKLAQYTGMTSLDVSGCPRLTDMTFLALFQKFKKLINLNVSGCKEISDESIMELAKNNKDLESIDLSKCNDLTSAAITALAKHCKDIKSINLSGCYWLADDSIKKLAQNCCLTSIDLSRNTWFADDAAIKALAVCCRGLEKINLSGCIKITEAALIELIRNCTGLTHIHLPNLSNYDEVIRILARERPNVTILSAPRLQKQLERYRRELSYKPSSTAGKLYLELLRNRYKMEKPDEFIKRLKGVCDLPEFTLGFLLSLSNDSLLSYVEEGMPKFLKENLSKAQTYSVYTTISRLNEAVTTWPETWGEKHAPDNLALLADALTECAAAVEEIETGLAATQVQDNKPSE